MYRLLSLFCGILFIQSCSESSGLKKSEVSNYEYKHFIANSGATPKVSDFAYFQMNIYDDKDSLLQTYRNQKILPSVQVLDPTDNARKRNPVVDIVSYLSVGDSVAILVPVDSVPNMPPGI